MVAASVGSAGGLHTGAAQSGGHGVTFGEVLSCLNPLQYLPVVGTIYRAVTGDTIPEPVREAGSLVVSGLTGGPVGVAVSLGVDLAEKAVGIDQEAMGQRVLAWLGIGHGAASPPAEGAPSPPVAVASSSPSAVPFSAAELASAGDGADGLNGLELGRLARASGAYGRSMTLA